MWTEEEVKSYADRCAELSHPDAAAIGINATKLARLVHVDAILSERQKAKPVVEALERVWKEVMIPLALAERIDQALKDYTSLK